MSLKASTSGCSRRSLRRKTSSTLLRGLTTAAAARVKAVDDMDGLGEEALANGAVGRPHIEADRLDLGAELRAKLFKVSNQGILRAFGKYVQGDVFVQVDQHAAVAALALAVGDGSGHPVRQCPDAARRHSGRAGRDGPAPADSRFARRSSRSRRAARRPG